MPSIGTFAPGSGGILDVTIPAPAAGLDWLYTVPTLTRLRLLFARATLTTSAVAIGRRPEFYLWHDGHIIWRSMQLYTPGASTISNFCLSRSHDQAMVVALREIPVNTPDPFIMCSDDNFLSGTVSIQPTDQWGPTYLRFEQWIEP